MCDNNNGKNKDITPNDDIVIEFVDHDQVFNVNESLDTISLEEPSLKEPSKEGEEKVKDLEEKYLRLRADFENYKKRVMKDLNFAQNSAQIEVLRAILPFIDNLERALENKTENVDDNWIIGIELSIKDLKNTLKQLGLEEVEGVGMPFNPSIHESVGFDTILDMENGVVTKIVQSGFTLNGRLVRPAKVFINRKGANN